jgi:dihydrodipicolinate reductase
MGIIQNILLRMQGMVLTIIIFIAKAWDGKIYEIHHVQKRDKR